MSESNYLRRYEVPYRMPDLAALGGACTRDDVDANLFHSSSRVPDEVRKQEKKAKEICETECPAKAYWPCRKWVLDAEPKQMLGVMGGLSKKDRDAIHKAAKAS